MWCGKCRYDVSTGMEKRNLDVLGSPRQKMESRSDMQSDVLGSPRKKMETRTDMQPDVLGSPRKKDGNTLRHAD